MRDVALAASGQMLIDLVAVSVAPGLTVLSGASGSGKSTLLALMSGLVRPDRGRILWDGIDLARLSEGARDRWRREHAGFVFQDFHLIDEMSPEENVLVPARFSRLSARALRPRAAELLDRMEVPARRRISVLSRGERQRVALARALLFDPPVLFADEPTASLDARNGARVADLLAALAAEGRTVIAASHDPAILGLPGRHLRLDHGRAA